MKPKQNNKPTKQKSELSIANLKKKLRDSKRLFKKVNAQKQIELNRVIDTLEKEIRHVLNEQKYAKLKEKYQYLKFVELKKVDRKLKKAQDSEIEELQLLKKYIQFYPKDVKYIAIYPKEDTKDSIQKRTEIKSKIQELDFEGKLVEGFSWCLNENVVEHEDSDVEVVDAAEKDDFFL